MMVQIARVDYQHAPAHFEYLRVERTGGILGARERVAVDPSFFVKVDAFQRPAREMKLDAAEAEQLIHALADVVARAPHEPGTPMPDQYTYVLEIGWNGQHLTFHIMEAPSDDALRGVLALVRKLLDHPPTDADEITIRAHGA